MTQVQGFREFTDSDWMAFAGCEDKNPLICDDPDSICVVIDGRSVSVHHNDGRGCDISDPEGIPIYAHEFDTVEQAHDVAYAVTVLACELSIAGLAHVLQAMFGEHVGTL